MGYDLGDGTTGQHRHLVGWVILGTLRLVLLPLLKLAGGRATLQQK